MKKRFLFISLIAIAILCSLSAISAMDNDDTNLNEVSLSDSDNCTLPVSDSADSMESSNDQSSSNIVNPVHFVAPDVVKHYKNGTDLKATLTDSDGNPISNQKVYFTLKSVQYVKTTNENGIATLPINLLQGSYSISVLFNGTECYNPAMVNSKITIIPNIESTDLTKCYKNGTQFDVVLIDFNGNPLANSKVSFTVKGKTYTKTTDGNGVASLPINLSQGKYTIVTKNLADNTFASNVINVLPNVVSSDLTKYYKNGTQFDVVLIDFNGNPLANSKVSFTVKGKTYTKTTDSKGVARLDINLNPGKYTIVTKNSVDGTSASNVINVLPTIITSDIVKACGDNKQFTAKIIDSSGNPLSGVKVRFELKGSNYDRITNNDGIASLSIGFIPGKYTITTTNLANSQKCSNSIVVVDRVDTDIEVLNNEIGVNSKDSLNVVLKNELNSQAPKEDVILVIDGKSYHCLTDNNGVATFNPNVNAGVYNATYLYFGTKYNCYTFKNVVITVLEGKNATFETSNDSIINKGSSFSVTVKDMEGSPIPNINLYFTIKDVNYDVVSDSNGVVSLPINLNPTTVSISYTINETGYNYVKGTKDLAVISNNNSVLSNIVGEYVKGQKLNVKLSADGVSLPNQAVSISLNNKTYYLFTDENGIASLTIGLKPGKYQFNCSYEGNSKIKGSNTVFNITVLDSMDTKLVYLGSNVCYKENGNFTVRLTGSNNMPISNRVVEFTVYGKTFTVKYNKTTDENGIALLPINLNEGSYTIGYKFYGDSNFKSSQGSQIISSKSKYYNRNGYIFIWMDEDADFEALAKQGTTDLLLHCKNLPTYGEEKVLNWIKKANSYGIKVNLWIPIFHNNIEFVPPISEDGILNTKIMEQRINEIKYYGTLDCISGLCIDFIRFPSTGYLYENSTYIISSFVKNYTDVARDVNPDWTLLSTIIPREEDTVRLHAQDIHAIGKCVDVIVPLIYKSSFTEKEHWMSNLAKWCAANCDGTPLWIAILGYKADAIQEPISIGELNFDINNMLTKGASGIQIFRWGPTYTADFNKLYKEINV